MGSEARARLGLAGLLLITLLSFSQVFAPGDYPGPALLGMIAAGGIAIGARRLGIRTISTLLLSACALVFYLIFVFHNAQTFFGLPTVTAARRLIESVSHSLERAQIDFAPVPVRTGYVVMVVTGLWAATTLAEIATFRWKRPLIASMPIVALFAMVMVVGTGRAGGFLVPLFLAMLLTYWGLESSHRLRSWGRWVPTWPGRPGNEEPASVTGNIARRMGAMCVVTAVIAPLFLPAIGDGLLAWRTGEAVGGPGGSGGGGGGRIDHLVSIAPTLLQQSDTRLFEVLTDNPGYWRLVTLGGFDGEEWRAVDSPTEEALGGAIEETPERLGAGALPGEELAQTFEIEELQGGNLPSVARAVGVQVPDRQGSLRYAPESGDLRLVGGLKADDRYTVTSAVRELSYSELVEAEPGREGQVDAIYFELPGSLTPAVEDFRDEAISVAGAETPYQQLVAIQARLRSREFTYSVEPGAEARGQLASTDYLTQFLTDTKTGYCQQFATAFAVLARSLGWPTRVVVGFLPGEALERGRYLVRGTDAHAWPEVYFEEHGWIAFEPTPRSSDQTGGGRIAAIPVYTLPGGGIGGFNPEGGRFLPGEQGAGTGGPSDGDSALRSFFAAEDAFLQTQQGGGLSSEDRANPRAGELDGSGPMRDPAWVGTFKRLFVAVALLAVLFLAAVPALKQWGIRRLYARAATPRDLAGAAFQEFLVNAGELVSAKGPAESARAYARRLAETAGLPPRAVLRLAAIYEASEYALEDLGADSAAEARTLVREIKSRLWGSASWWSRILRLFSVRSLRLSGLRPAFGALPFVKSH